MSLSGLNWLSVVISIIVTFASGAIWFGPKTFYPVWMRAMGRTPEQNGDNSAMFKVFSSLIASIIIEVVVLAALITTLSKHNPNFGVANGAITGFLIGLAICSMPNLSHRLFAGNGFKVWLIENGNDILNMTMIGAIIAAMN